MTKDQAELELLRASMAGIRGFAKGIIADGEPPARVAQALTMIGVELLIREKGVTAAAERLRIVADRIELEASGASPKALN